MTSTAKNALCAVFECRPKKLDFSTRQFERGTYDVTYIQPRLVPPRPVRMVRNPRHPVDVGGGALGRLVLVLAPLWLPGE